MAGKRIKDTSITQKLEFQPYYRLLIDKMDGEYETDWLQAKNMSLSFIGNTYFQGSTNGLANPHAKRSACLRIRASRRFCGILTSSRTVRFQQTGKFRRQQHPQRKAYTRMISFCQHTKPTFNQITAYCANQRFDPCFLRQSYFTPMRQK